jgi:hypothetical protein
MKTQLPMKTFGIILVLVLQCSCNNSEIEDDMSSTSKDSFLKLYKMIYNVVSIDSTSSDEYVMVRTTGVPDHKTPFFGKGHEKYEEYNGDNPNFSTAINLMGTISDPTLLTQSITFRFPKYPAEATTHVSTTGGAFGIGRNGVVYFNQYNGAGAALDDLEINNADQYLGHPTPSMGGNGGTYHYHYEPKWLTTSFGNESFVGFLLDGFPIYGPYENGIKITNDMLDEFHGHSSTTTDYPTKAIYHYHITSATSSKPEILKLAAPYINGGKYYGTKGIAN